MTTIGVALLVLAAVIALTAVALAPLLAVAVAVTP